jgi:FkbM family methyltransferase
MDRSQLDMGTNTQITNEYMFREILDDRVYEKFFSVKDNDIVLDIGANVGVFPFSIQNKRLKRLICVEPSLSIVDALKKNLHKLGYDTDVYPVGIGQKTGTQHITEYDWIFGDHSDTFESITFKELLQRSKLDHIDFMKIDCEGGEYNVFTQANHPFLTNNVGYIVGEWHLFGMENGIEKWNIFVDQYLRGKRNFRVFEPYVWKEVTSEVFDSTYARRYYDWWVPRGTAAHFAVYIDNKGDSISW